MFNGRKSSDEEDEEASIDVDGVTSPGAASDSGATLTPEEQDILAKIESANQKFEEDSKSITSQNFGSRRGSLNSLHSIVSSNSVSRYVDPFKIFGTISCVCIYLFVIGSVQKHFQGICSCDFR